MYLEQNVSDWYLEFSMGGDLGGTAGAVPQKFDVGGTVMHSSPPIFWKTPYLHRVFWSVAVVLKARNQKYGHQNFLRQNGKFSVILV